MKGSVVLAVFLVLVVAQLGVPAYMIVRHESTLASGDRFLFECEPVNPVDALRGHFVSLDFREDAAVAIEDGFRVRQTAYAELEVAEDGYARLGRLSFERPAEGPYVRVRVSRRSGFRPASAGDKVKVVLPFDRYYLQEARALAAEDAYWESSRSGTGEEVPTHVAVRVHDGHAVLEELYFDGVPIGEYLSSH